MAELGETNDPKALITGDPDAVEENVRVLQARADQANKAAEGLRAIDTGAWEGPAATAFHDKFSYEPPKWAGASDSLTTAAQALGDYAHTLRWAQGQAIEAVAQWNQAGAQTQQAKTAHDLAATQATAQNQPPPPFNDHGEATRQNARSILDRARQQFTEAGDVAAGILRGETDMAPEESSWLDDVGEFVADAGAHMVNGLVSFGNAVLHHPGDVLTALGGAAITVVSAAGFGAGGGLEITGVGAVPGIALQGVSAAGMATGSTMVAGATAAIMNHAAGDDHVEVVKTNEGEPTPPEPPAKVTGRTAHGDEQVMGRDGGRGVNDKAINDAVENPTKDVKVQHDARGWKFKYSGKDATVVLNEQGEVITAYGKGTAGLRNPK